jgi:methylated-DNA-[protein]-cysteine S-methyltransferase
VIHRSLRPEAVALAPRLAVLDVVDAFHAGEVGAIDDVVVRQRSGPFLTEAWEMLRTVPAGRPDTYAAFAARCGRPTAVRAAANACARNAAALFVPCHRVMGSDGGMGGFRWGTDVKRWLLDHEAEHMKDPRAPHHSHARGGPLHGATTSAPPSFRRWGEAPCRTWTPPLSCSAC